MNSKASEPKFGASLRWQSINVTVQVMLQLAFIAALARLISTEAFGVMAIALVIVGFIEIFAQVGIGPALIQNPNVTEDHKRTAFVFSLSLGIIFFIATWLAAPVVASFYKQPLLVEVLRWISVSFIISGASVVPRSMIIKEMRFKSLFICSFIAMVIGNILVGLSLAWNGAGIWAYVIALLTQNTLLGIGYWITAPGPVGIFMNRSALKSMIGYGGRSTIFNMINYAAGKIDTMVLAAQTSNWTLTGLYDRSAYLMGLPVTVLGKLGDSVLFSGMSMMQNDIDRLKKTVLSAVHAVLILVIPLSVFLILRSEDVTVLFLGSSFIKSGSIVQILFACVALRSFVKIGDATMRATDHLSIGSFIKLGFLILVGGGAWWAMKSDVSGISDIKNVAWAVTFATSLQALAVGVWMVHGIHIKTQFLMTRLVPGVSIGLLVILGEYFLSLITGLSTISENWLPELQRSLIIVTHILISAILTFILVFLYPEFIDGGSPELRRKIFQRIQITRLKNRLTR